MEAYRRAIADAAKGQIVLDIGTGALALLALFAAESGASHVYALEVNEHVYKQAVAVVAASKFHDKITVIQGYSTEVALPQPATLLVHELIGEVAGEEGVVRCIRDAGHRHLDPNATPPLSIPNRARSLLAPCELPTASSHPAYCASLPPGRLPRPGQSQALKLPALPSELLLAPPQPFEDLRFETAQPEGTQHCERIFAAARHGTLRALAIHVDLFCHPSLAAHQAFAEVKENEKPRRASNAFALADVAEAATVAAAAAANVE